MSDTEYSDLVTFLDSPQSNPVYPIGMRTCPKKDKHRKKKRQRFRDKCSKFTVEDKILYRFVNFGSSKVKTQNESLQGILVRVRVAKQVDVNYDLFKQFHHDKGHIGQRQGRETLRRHWFFHGYDK